MPACRGVLRCTIAGHYGYAVLRWTVGLGTHLFLLGGWWKVGGGGARATFYRVSVHRCAPLGLSIQSRLLSQLPLELLYAQVMLVDGYAQDYLGAVLVDDKLVQMLSQHLGRDVTHSHVARGAQRASRGLVRLVEGLEALATEVGAIEPRRRTPVRLRQGCAARDAVESEVRCAGLWRYGDGQGPVEDARNHHGDGAEGVGSHILELQEHRERAATRLMRLR